MNITISADAVAWYGAVVATASAVAAAYAVWRDRRVLKVSASPDMKLLEDAGPSLSAKFTYIFVEVANIGRRPANLAPYPYFRLKNEKQSLVIFGDWEPSSHLEEGQSAKMLVKQDQQLDLSQVSCVVVKDATGRQWKGRVAKSAMKGKVKHGDRRA